MNKFNLLFKIAIISTIFNLNTIANAKDKDFCNSINTISDLSLTIKPYKLSNDEIEKSFKNLNKNQGLKKLYNAYQDYYLHILLRIETEALEELSQDFRDCGVSQENISELNSISLEDLKITQAKKNELLYRIKSTKLSEKEIADRSFIVGAGAMFSGIAIIILSGGALATGAPVIIGGILVVGGAGAGSISGLKSAWIDIPVGYREWVLKNTDEENYKKLVLRSNSMAKEALKDLLY